jgi:hypothetical protein
MIYPPYDEKQNRRDLILLYVLISALTLGALVIIAACIDKYLL